MFTGIITGTGRILCAQALGADPAHGKRLCIAAPAGYLDDVCVGESIALNGACMTVVHADAARAQFDVDISAESLEKTAALDTPGAQVNLEKALRATDRLGGHIVSGHVDGVGLVQALESTGESQRLRILAPAALARFLALKGSVAVDGVSLTLNAVQDSAQGCAISINLIPHTVAHTTLGGLRAGSRVNLEIDLLARYCERMLAAQQS